MRFGRPSDLAEAYDQGHQEEEVVMEFVVRARRGKFLPINNRLRQFFGQRSPVRELFALEDVNFDYDDIKIKTRVGNSTRTIDLASPENLRSYRDVSDQVQVDANGHPRFDSIHRIAEEILGEIKEEMYGGAQ